MFFLLFACLQKHLVDLYFMHNKVQTQVIVLFVQAARRWPISRISARIEMRTRARSDSRQKPNL